MFKELKENLKQKQEKAIKLSDIHWVDNRYDYKNIDLILVPYILNNDETKFKDLSTGEIVKIDIISDNKELNQQQSIADYLKTGSKTLTFSNTPSIMVDNMNSVYPLSNKTMFKLNRHLNKINNVLSDPQKCAYDFCLNTKITEEDLIKLTKTLKNALKLTKDFTLNNIEEKNRLQAKKQKEEQDYIDNVKNF